MQREHTHSLLAPFHSTLSLLHPSLLPRHPQALSKRIHYGKFVAEAKFRKQTDEYRALIARQDGAAILELLTDRAVELKVCMRVLCVRCAV